MRSSPSQSAAAHARAWAYATESLAGPRGPFRLLWLTAVLLRLGAWTTVIAVPLKVYAHTDSTAWVAAVVAAELLPPLAVGLLLPSTLDRTPLRVTALAACAAGASAFAALAAVSDPRAVLALVALAGAAVAVLVPVLSTWTPLLVDDEELDVANGAIASVSVWTSLVGEATGGALVAAVGSAAVLGGTAATFVLGGASLLLVPLPRAPRGAADGVAGAGVRAVLAAICAHPVLRQVALGWSVASVAIGAQLGLMVPFLRDGVGLSPASVGVVISGASVGILAGTVAAGRLGARLAPLYPLLLATMSAGLFLTAAAHGTAVAFAGFALTGIANGLAIVYNTSAVQRHTAPERRAGTNALVLGVAYAGGALGAVGAGALGEVVELRTAFALVAALMLAAVPLAAALAPGAGRRVAPARA